MECELVARDGVLAGGSWPTRKVKRSSWFGSKTEVVERVPGHELRANGKVVLLSRNAAVVPNGVFCGDRMINIPPSSDKIVSASETTWAVYIKERKLLLLHNDTADHPAAVSLSSPIVSLQVVDDSLHVVSASSHNNRIAAGISFFPNGVGISSTDTVTIPAGITLSAAFSSYSPTTYTCALIRYSVQKAIFTQNSKSPTLATLTPKGIISLYRIVTKTGASKNSASSEIILPEFGNLANVYEGNQNTVAESCSSQFLKTMQKKGPIQDICWVPKRNGDRYGAENENLLLLSFEQQVLLVDVVEQCEVFCHKFSIECTILLPQWGGTSFQEDGIEIAVLPKSSDSLDLEFQRIVPMEVKEAIKKSIIDGDIDKSLAIAAAAGMSKDVVYEQEWEVSSKTASDVKRILSKLPVPSVVSIAKSDLTIIDNKVNIIAFLTANNTDQHILDGLTMSLAGCMLLSDITPVNEVLSASGESIARSHWWRTLCNSLVSRRRKHRHPLMKIAKKLAAERDIQKLQTLLRMSSKTIPSLASIDDNYMDIMKSLPASTTIEEAEPLLPAIGINTILQPSVVKSTLMVTEAAINQSESMNTISELMMYRTSQLGLHTISTEWMRYSNNGILKADLNEFTMILKSGEARRLLFGNDVPTFGSYDKLNGLIKLCGIVIADSRSRSFKSYCERVPVSEDLVTPLSKFSMAALEAKVSLSSFPLSDDDISKIFRAVIERQSLPTLGISNAIGATKSGMTNITTKVTTRMGLDAVTEGIPNINLRLPTQNVTNVFSKVMTKTRDVHQKLCQDVGLVQSDSPNTGIRVKEEFVTPVMEVLKQHVCGSELDLSELLLRVLLIDGQHQAALHLIKESNVNEKVISKAICNSLDNLLNRKTNEVPLDGIVLQTGRQVIAIFDELIDEGVISDPDEYEHQIAVRRDELESLLEIVIQYSEQLPSDMKVSTKEDLLKTIVNHCEITESNLHILVDNIERLGEDRESVFHTIITHSIVTYKPDLAFIASHLIISSSLPPTSKISMLLRDVLNRFQSVMTLDQYLLISSALAARVQPSGLHPVIDAFKKKYLRESTDEDQSTNSYGSCINKIINNATNMTACNEELGKIEWITEVTKLQDQEESERKGVRGYEKVCRLAFDIVHTEHADRKSHFSNYQKWLHLQIESHARLLIQCEQSAERGQLSLFIPLVELAAVEDDCRDVVIAEHTNAVESFLIIAKEFALRSNFIDLSNIQFVEFQNRLNLITDLDSCINELSTHSGGLFDQTICGYESTVEVNHRMLITEQEQISRQVSIPLLVEASIEYDKLTQEYYSESLTRLPEMEKRQRRVISSGVKLGYLLLGIEGMAGQAVAQIRQIENAKWKTILSDFDDGSYERRFEKIQLDAVSTMTTLEVSEHIQWEYFTKTNAIQIDEYCSHQILKHQNATSLTQIFEDEKRYQIECSEEEQVQSIIQSKQSEQADIFERLEALGLFIISEEDERSLITNSCSKQYGVLESEISISLSDTRNREVDRLRLATKFENELSSLPDKEVVVRTEITFEQSAHWSELMSVCERQKFTAMTLSVSNSDGSNADTSSESALLSKLSLLGDSDILTKFESEWSATRPPLQPSPNFLKLSVAAVSSLIALSPSPPADSAVVFNAACKWLCLSVFGIIEKPSPHMELVVMNRFVNMITHTLGKLKEQHLRSKKSTAHLDAAIDICEKGAEYLAVRL
eukprot:TRINITY_DN3118_c0_g1_i1.p1 TRINITY_DN3118_c0_g1~~TRINITY_DN3118_c0_g1_i1.p1  ORF type:complete len:1725 (+),score=359.98 TRINITY_DN3118_c0_g1_i1:51-5177(+)